MLLEGAAVGVADEQPLQDLSAACQTKQKHGISSSEPPTHA